MARWGRTLAGAAMLATALLSSRLATNPKLQGYKQRIAPWLAIQHQYDQPTTRIPNAPPEIPLPTHQDDRPTLDARVQKLFIVRSDATAEERLNEAMMSTNPIASRLAALVHTDYDNAGGVLLTKTATRTAHVFGKYTSYDPEKTVRTVQAIQNQYAARNKHVIILDEGEGGYSQRVGTLPAAADIATFLETGVVGATASGQLNASTSTKDRQRQIRALYSRFGRELRVRGVNAVLGPLVDIQTNNDNPLAADDRIFSDKYRTVEQLASLYIEALHEWNIKVVPKHFPTLGPIATDLHQAETCVPKADRPLLQQGADIYKQLADKATAHPDGVLISHAGNPSDNCRPYSISHRVYEYLRNDTYANGQRGLGLHTMLAVVDDVTMAGLRQYIVRAETARSLAAQELELITRCATAEAKAAVLAVNAGADVIITRRHIAPAVACIVANYHADKTFAARVDSALDRMERFSTVPQ